MDNKTPQQNVPSGQNPQPVGPLTSSDNLAASGSRVIQPLNPNVQPEDSQPSQEALSPAPEVDQAPIAPPTQAPIPSSIYPEPVVNTADYHAPSPDIGQTNLSTTEHSNKLIVIVVVVIGVLISIAAAASLITDVRTISVVGFGNTMSVLGLVLAVAQLLLGIGLIIRQEIARRLYVILAVLFLALSLYGTYTYFTTTQRLNQLQQQAIVRTQQQIAQYQSDVNLPLAAKTSIISSLQQTEQRQKDALNKNQFSLVPLLEKYALSILPLIFLTRPSVKRVFK